MAANVRRERVRPAKIGSFTRENGMEESSNKE
jgi:hypothetical protein